MKNELMKSLLRLGVVLITLTSCSKEDAGPQTPPCGNIEVTSDEVIAGVQFLKGKYQINVLACLARKSWATQGYLANSYN